jgi:hypothetical protein
MVVGLVATLSKGFAAMLILVHVALGAWGLVGFLELALPNVPWTRLSNVLFSPPMLVLQWTLVCLAAAVFIAGYLGRWSHTPVAMLCVYATMALVCAYQTFFILTSATRFHAMAAEYLAYTVILLFLFLSEHMQLRFASA